MELSDLTLDRARALAGTTFAVGLPDGASTTVVLDEALPYDLRPHRRARAGHVPRRDPFALYFLGDPAMILPQGTYRLESATATFEMLFIVPIGHDAQATEYEAVFT